MPGEFNSAAAAADIIAAGPVDLTATAPKRTNKQRKARKKGAKKKGGPKLKSPPFVIELVSAQDLPAADVGINVVDALRGDDDLFSGTSDPYIVAWLSHTVEDESEWEEEAGLREEVLGSRRRSATKLETTAPVWRFHTDFNISQRLAAGSVLNIEVYDEDLHTGDDLLGSLRIPVDLLPDVAHTYPLEVGKAAGSATSMTQGTSECEILQDPTTDCPTGQPGVTLRRVPIEPGTLPDTMVVFLVEHGESADHEKGVADVIIDAVATDTLSRIDYPMSCDGIQHMRTLAQAWQQEAAVEVEDRDEKKRLADWMAIDRIFSSPMTRAVQSSLLLMAEHPRLKAEGTVLLASARDIKTGRLAGHHTGVAIGAQEVTNRALQMFREVAAADASETEVEAEIGALREAAKKLDSFDSASSWWTPGSDTDSAPALAIRFHEFVGALRYYRPGDSRVAVTTHSRFIMRFMRHFTPTNTGLAQLRFHAITDPTSDILGLFFPLLLRTTKEAYQIQSPRLKQMCTEFLHHGSVVAVEMHFREGKGTDQCSITAATPLFATFAFKSGGDVAPHRDLAKYKGASYDAVKQRQAASVKKKGGLFGCCCGGEDDEPSTGNKP